MRRKIELALHCYQSGDLQKAASLLKEVLKKRPDDFYALNSLGVISIGLKDYDSAADYLLKAARLSPANSNIQYNLGNVYREKGNFLEAERSYRKAIELNPQFFESRHNLGSLYQNFGRYDEALENYRKAAELDPRNPVTHYNIAIILQDRGEDEEAIAMYRKAAESDPQYLDAYFNLGGILKKKGLLNEALTAYQKVIELNPGLADAYYSLGVVHEEKGDLENALSSYQKTLSIDPRFADAYNNMGNIMQKRSDLEMALSCYHKAILLKPDSPIVLVNLGNLLRDLGNHEEAEKCYREAIAMDPYCAYGYDNLFFLMLYSPSYNQADVLAEELKFAERFERPLQIGIQNHRSTKNPERKLKIGYASADFRKHPVASFIEPVLAAHTEENFDVYCYSDVPSDDEITVRLRGLADRWRNISGKTDEAVADMIRHDGIDILIDLAGHTAHNRLLVFARKPAPIQASWIGYAATTGLSSIDYKIVDLYTDPPGMTEQFYSEELLRMPESFLCFLPNAESPEVAPPPSVLSGHITFGSFNNFAKISGQTIDLWAEILKRVPYSRLVLKANALSGAAGKGYALDLFAQRGIAGDRIELRGWERSEQGHLNAYGEIDIGLDTFPYHGTTTTCESLWMGVPVITLAGNAHLSRVGVSLLSNVGLPELVANNGQEYVHAAATLASDLPKLQHLRTHLREMMLRSSLCDPKKFTANFEESLRNVWRKWCAEA